MFVCIGNFYYCSKRHLADRITTTASCWEQSALKEVPSQKSSGPSEAGNDSVRRMEGGMNKR